MYNIKKFRQRVKTLGIIEQMLRIIIESGLLKEDEIKKIINHIRAVRATYNTLYEKLEVFEKGFEDENFFKPEKQQAIKTEMNDLATDLFSISEEIQ